MDPEQNHPLVEEPSVSQKATDLPEDALVASEPPPVVTPPVSVPPSSVPTEEPAVVEEEDRDVVFSEEAAAKLIKRGLKEPDERPHMNVVFIGHVDAGKSTTCGNILFLTGQVDARTIEKFTREAKEKNRDTWYYAYVMDINEDEREKGKTVEVGRAAFTLPGIRYTILDAPGHRGFVPEMLAGAAQADVGVLIISARKGEFEAGFERGGQTREHAMLAKTLGVNQLIVAVNKMDEGTVNWSQARYDDICRKLAPFLRSCGFNPAKDLTFLPISGLAGQNIAEHVSDPNSKVYDDRASWYPVSEPTLFKLFQNMEPPKRDATLPLRVPLLAGHKDNGVVAVGKVESGVVMVDQPALLMPNRTKVKIVGVRCGDEDYAYAMPGENVELRLMGIEEDAIKKGCVLSSIKQPVPTASLIEAQVVIVELLEHRPLLTAGYKCVLHAHTVCEEVEIERLIDAVQKSTKKRQKHPAFVKADMIVTCWLRLSQTSCLEPFSAQPQLGRFTLRDEGKTIAIGKVLKIRE
eukprot:Protomagalhaensia_wolfi_Nauph_80__766@NODE_143_length_3458_cov_147_083943_g106_i0_p1_GENE_NODE_143_length_3458_cov_147_083943_g106_i0NODE_143_length_3458_cov_147_083943_g106_i0_p1_ORF_typecomplete_len521_score133_39GTP_EFTU/PF00009_27/2_9e45GTP_EFTU_D3/PF03143_17/1_9e27GTP_EFTU_D2/PF03144_25/2_7e02GTP_EFTU_D2/PF03144_25/0_00056MMR_HSR1/PF01926_23/0_0022FeoB_N/PF02421_18/3_4e02FeoB_N/PF02421_18/0_062AIG1/PF04548_16/0_16_NODE_143_length_3458_cov_147_083943_g106_i0731635